MMKNCLILACVALSLFAADLELKLNEGDVNAIKLTGDMAAKTSIRVINPESITWETGRDGKPALSFKLVTEMKKIPSIAIRKTAEMDLSKPFSFMCWVKPDAKIKRNAFHEIFSNCHSDRGPGPRLCYGWSALRLMSGDGKNNRSIASNSAKNLIKNGTWNHFAMVWDGKVASIYVNGLKANSSTEPMTFLNGEKELYIGSYRGGYANGFCGLFSDVKIYFHALDDRAILQDAIGY